jgi:hypothetical protein
MYLIVLQITLCELNSRFTKNWFRIFKLCKQDSLKSLKVNGVLNVTKIQENGQILTILDLKIRPSRRGVSGRHHLDTTELLLDGNTDMYTFMIYVYKQIYMATH